MEQRFHSETGPALNSISPAKLIVMVVGVIACAAIMPVMDKTFTSRQMASSSALLLMLSIPFLFSLVVSIVRPWSAKAHTYWIVLAASAFFAGDALVIFRDTGDNHTLWPIELVMLTGLATGALFIGAICGRACMKKKPV